MNSIIYLVMILLGVFLIVSSIKSLLKLNKAKSYSGSAEGEIVEVLENYSVSKGQRSYYYVPVYEFSANGKNIHKKADFNTSDKNKYKAGDKVSIKFDTSNPEQFQAEGSAGSAMAQYLILLVAGIVFLAMALVQLSNIYL